MKSISEAKNLSVQAELALIESIRARDKYIQGLESHLGDDELRRLHHDAMAAADLADKAKKACFGERKVQFYA